MPTKKKKHKKLLVSDLKKNDMRKILFLAFLLVNTFVFAQDEVERRGCIHEIFDKRQPYFIKKSQALENELARITATGQASAFTGVLKVPIVFHIIYSTDAQNLSDSFLNSQIAILNNDYRNKSGSTWPQAADLEFEFSLAKKDPNGNPTTGITRHKVTQANWDMLNNQDEIVKITNSAQVWPSDKYLNIWIAEFRNSYLGYGVFPEPDDNTPFEGLYKEGRTNENDGLFIDYRVVGATTGGIYSNYNLGRTATHEIGHFFGLIHIWGDVDSRTGGVCGNDFVSDTPPAAYWNSSRTCNRQIARCTGATTETMIENYLDYSYDRCMNTFTKGQKDRVRKILEIAPRRRRLIEANNPKFPEVTKLTINADSAKVIGSERFQLTLTNPSDAIRIQILLKGESDVTIDIMDTMGKPIYREAFVKTGSFYFEPKLAPLSVGTYFLRASTATESVIQRIGIVR
jgi:hypothetical protein